MMRCQSYSAQTKKILSKEDVSEDIIKDVAVHRNYIDLLTSSTPAMGSVNATSHNNSWVEIPVAIDS